MATTWYAFFDSTPEDPRMILAEDWARHNRSLFTDGVRNGGECLEVVPGGGLSVNVKPGIATIQGYLFRADADDEGECVNVKIPTANPYSPRVDRIVIRLDRRIERREIVLTYKMGTAGATPAPPELERNENIWELSLAKVNVGANQTGIVSADIVDERFDTELCGLMNTLLKLDSSSWQTLVNNSIDSLMLKWDTLAGQKLLNIEQACAAEQLVLEGVKGDFEQWFSTVRLAIGLAAQFDFDNNSTRPTTTVTTTATGNIIITEIRNNTTNEMVAKRTVTFESNGLIITNEKVYSGLDIVRDVTITTSFSQGGVTEVVV